ncbi:hypothetical protein VPNG_09469 [Cytospora leucostoma]|uniref:Uncharacterized protein n=1 Tax=Cytospora leucostoma TaxID=1230097 RepID=A0A423VVG9_9PEZI|nr:hypothetical protein VPNG_09469 [Cytospora leucostoma]
MTAANSDTELLTEHFGYPPVKMRDYFYRHNIASNLTARKSLLDEIINSINFIAERALASVEQGLLNAPPQQIGFGKPAAASKANSKSKRKGRHQTQPPPQQAEDAPDPSPEEMERRAHDEISNGTHQLETLLCASIDRNFDKFELYVMRNILCVRPEDRDWMRLGHYEGLNFDNLPPPATTKPNKKPNGGDDDDNNDNNGDGDGDGADKMDIDAPPDVPTVESVNRLRRRLQASQRLNTMLHAEKARNDALLGELRSLVGRVGTDKGKGKGATDAKQEPQTSSSSSPDGGAGRPAPFAFLRDRGDLTQADADTPLSTTTAFSLSQLQALRALSTSLSNIMPSLGDQGGGAAGAGGEGADGATGRRKTWRRERVEYVEGAARKHLEKVRGLELGGDGEVRDGEWQGEGRRFASGEVAALEGLVSALEKTDGGGSGGGGEAMDEDVAE